MNTRKILPKWLHEYIFDSLGAEEKPNPKEFCKNLHSDDEKNRIYLGTYFPRSFAESFCIHDNLFSYRPYQQSIEGKQKLTILSVGCGTGGDVLGALCAIAKDLPNITDVEIVAYDGNNIAIDYLVDLTSLEPLKSRFNIEHKCVPLPITCREDLEHYIAYIGEGYDLITSFKFVNELMDAGYLERDAFKVVAELLAPKLAETGILTLLDVTDKHLGEWQSKNMNYGLCEFSKTHDEFRKEYEKAVNNYINHTGMNVSLIDEAELQAIKDVEASLDATLTEEEDEKPVKISDTDSNDSNDSENSNDSNESNSSTDSNESDEPNSSDTSSNSDDSDSLEDF